MTREIGLLANPSRFGGASAQEKTADIGIVGDGFGRSIEMISPIDEHIGAVGDLENGSAFCSTMRIAMPSLAILRMYAEELVRCLRAETCRRLVEQKCAGLAHESHRYGEDLTLSA